MNSGERFVVLGVAPVRREWFRLVGRWATEATLPIEFIRCISTNELASRLQSGRPFSAAIIDAGSTGFDRDLIDLAASVGCATIVVDHGLVRRDWSELGATAVLPDTFASTELLALLGEFTDPISHASTLTPPPPPTDAAQQAGRVVTVTGSGGQGSSVVAMGLAQGLARAKSDSLGERHLLADMALRSSQAMMHDTRDVIPGLLEFVEAHRLGTPDGAEAARSVHVLPDRGYELLLGLRHERDWGSVPAAALDASWGSLIHHYDVIVADVTGEFDGEDETGAPAIEDRNRLARAAVRRADLLLVVGTAGARGIHHLVRTIVEIDALGVDMSRVVPVVNRSPRRPRLRASLTSAIADLLRSRVSAANQIPNAIHLPDRPSIEDQLRDEKPLPSAFVDPLTSATRGVLERMEPVVRTPLLSTEPVPVAVGSLGTWSDDD